MTAVVVETCLAELLTHWREQHGLTPSEAARLVGVQGRTWLSWESGTAPQLSALSGLAEAVGLACTDLLSLLPERLGEREDGCGEIASAVRSWRRSEAMSLGRAARRLGVSPSTVLDWEAGRQPRRSQLTRLVAAGVVSR